MGWEELVNEHLIRAGLAVRIAHRTMEAQRIQLTRGRKIGVSLERQHSRDLPPGSQNALLSTEALPKRTAIGIMRIRRRPLKRSLTASPPSRAAILRISCPPEHPGPRNLLRRIKVLTSPELVEMRQDLHIFPHPQHRPQIEDDLTADHEVRSTDLDDAPELP
jgi:hypothetical protein